MCVQNFPFTFEISLKKKSSQNKQSTERTDRQINKNLPSKFNKAKNKSNKEKSTYSSSISTNFSTADSTVLIELLSEK